MIKQRSMNGVTRGLFLFLFLLCANPGLSSWGSLENFSSVLEHEFDDAVMITSLTQDGKRGICSGVLLAPDWVATAAHCILGNSQHRVNRANRTKGWVEATSVFPHPRYDPKISYSASDIGLIRLKSKIQGASKIKPICSQNPLGSQLYRVGFGGRGGLNQKMVFELTAFDYWSRHQTYMIPDENSTSGDSGGPIYAIEEGRPCLFAIHSTITVGEGPRMSYNPSLITAMPNFMSLIE